MKKTKSAIALGVAFAFTITIAGCSSAPEKIAPASVVPAGLAKAYEAAKTEKGTVTVFTQQQPQDNANIIAEWTRLFPDAPTLVLAAYAGAEANTRYGADRESGACSADVIVSEPAPIVQFAAKGWILDQSEENVPQRKLYNEATTANATYTIYGYTPQGIVYNTDNLKEAPSLETLAKPSMKGKLGLGDPRTAPSVVIGMWAVDQQMGAEALESFAAQGPKYFNSAVPGGAAVASGELNAYYPAYYPSTVTLLNQGAPVDFVVPEGLSASQAAIGISKGDKCDNPKSAILFTQFILSPEGQATAGGLQKKATGLLKPVPYKGLRSYPAPLSSADLKLPTDAELEAVKPKILVGLGLK